MDRWIVCAKYLIEHLLQLSAHAQPLPTIRTHGHEAVHRLGDLQCTHGANIIHPSGRHEICGAHYEYHIGNHTDLYHDLSVVCSRRRRTSADRTLNCSDRLRAGMGKNFLGVTSSETYANYTQQSPDDGVRCNNNNWWNSRWAHQPNGLFSVCKKARRSSYGPVGQHHWFRSGK